jgi:hypothetical protein
MGEICFWLERQIPYSEPEAYIDIDTYYRTNIAEIDESGMVRICMGMAGGLEPDYVKFFWKHYEVVGPYVEFWIDDDGSAPYYSTVLPSGEGDGWSGYLDPGIFNPDGEMIDFKACAHSGAGTHCDSITVLIDPTPPKPVLFSYWPPDSLGLFMPDSMHPVTCLHLDEDPDTVKMGVWPLATEKHRSLATVNQLGLGTAEDSMACAPASAASCLDYFAKNGHPELSHPGGDTSKPAQGADDTARELIGRMGTDKGKGTSALNMAKGIKQYLEAHGKAGWEVDGELVKDYHDIASMFREFEADEEDVMMLLKDSVTTKSGAKKEIGHFVTLGSKATTFYVHQTEWGHIPCNTYRLDFMDPWGGGSTQNNEYNVDENDKGEPVLQGYKIGNGPTRVAGYIKVSPPEDGGAGDKMFLEGSRLNAPSSGGWIMVDSKPASGGGIEDTLYWDTTGFEPGTYLLEVIATDADGNTAREIRLCGIPFFTTDTEKEGGTPRPSGLIGCYPNPFNPNTIIIYNMAKKGPVHMAIYDVSGRLVRTLLEGEVIEAGRRSARWDGMNSRGAPVASGTYFCRMKCTVGESSIKLIMLR